MLCFKNNINFNLLVSSNRINYVALPFGPLRHKNNLKKIFALQKKFMSLLIFSDYREHASPIFKSLKVLKL